ncbi:hypothetical protein IFM89_033793 [Coptis chinensis]|uniref:GATA-type domain-containing protein n=1 Tax=Coptis chinensis TaxID=261450 RepID=A0A835LPB0_9MAGN|nr:hypothetical protein IFM89_033793 [Coptis chinensis]
MPEDSRSSLPHSETEQIGPNYFAYYLREIDELFSQEEDFSCSLSPKTSRPFARITANVNDYDSAENNCNSKEALNLSGCRTLFANGVGEHISVFRKERLKVSLKQSVPVFRQEVDEMVDPVLLMYKIKKHLSDRQNLANNLHSAECHTNQSPYKKQKKSSSPPSNDAATHAGALGSQSCEEASGSEDMDKKHPCVPSSEDTQSRGLERVCLNCKTTNTPQWRWGPAGTKTLCNACGLRNKKKSMSPLNSNKVAKSLKHELDEDLQVLLEASGSHAKEAVKKYSDELFGKLGHMEQQLEKFLDVIMSKCRKMTRPEKQRLRTLIKNLPPKNLDRVVDIIVQHRKLQGHSCDEIHIDLENEDNTTLWRLYYYVEAVASANS